jgi:CheY-like chemotaxis protein
MTISIGRRKMFLTPWRPDRVSLRCLLVDDNDAFLEAASALLRAEGATVVGVAWSISEATRKAHVLRPDVVLVDIGLGDESGFDLARITAGSGQGSSRRDVILISVRAEMDYAELIAASPAAGFLAKSDLSVRESAGSSAIPRDDKHGWSGHAEFELTRRRRRRAGVWAAHHDRPVPSRLTGFRLVGGDSRRCLAGARLAGRCPPGACGGGSRPPSAFAGSLSPTRPEPRRLGGGQAGCSACARLV